jgi:hypothetical protein
MAIGWWNKLKSGFKRFAKGVKNVWNKISPVVQKIVPVIADKIKPGLGTAIGAGLGVANQFINGDVSGALKQGAGLAGVRLGDLANVKLRGGG